MSDGWLRSRRLRLRAGSRRLRAGLLRAVSLAYFGLFLGPRGSGRPAPATVWNEQWRQGAWQFLGDLEELPRYAVIAGLIRAISPPPSVLDLGCGHGQLWAVLGADAVSAYHGVDISTEAVEQARQRSAGPATFEAADLLAWHAPTRFDVIVLNEVLYYLPDPVAAVSHAYGMLAAGGVLVISMFRHRNVPLLWRDLSRHFPLVVYADVKNGKGEVVNVRLVRAAPAAPTPAPTDR